MQPKPDRSRMTRVSKRAALWLGASMLGTTVFPQCLQADQLIVHCPLGCPSVNTGNDLVIYHLFALSNDPNTKFADWVAYEVDVTNFGVSPGRNFGPDPMLDPAKTLEPDDYKHANSDPALHADKGHQAPLASFAGNHYWYETNYLSNITPQDGDLNQGPWKDLEDAVRSAVSFRQPLYVITGTTYEGGVRGLPDADEDNDVPDGYFKIVYKPSGEAAYFWMPQSADRHANYCDFKATPAEVNAKIDFTLPGALQESDEVYNALGCPNDPT